MITWCAVAFNCVAIILIATWPRPNHVEDMREMFGISDGALAQVRHRVRRWRRKLPPAARVTTLVIQRSFGPLIVATILAAIALVVSAYAYPEPDLGMKARITAIASNTLERMSQGALTIPGAEALEASDLANKALLASFLFVLSAGLFRVLQQWLLSVVRTIACLVFRENAYECLSGETRSRPKLAAVLGVQPNYSRPAKSTT